MRIKPFFILCGLFLVFSCKKETEVIPGNNPPVHTTVTDAQYRAYINRCYIQVHGTEPDSSAMDASLSVLKSGSFDFNSRKKFLDTLFSKEAYKWQIFNTCRQDYLNNTDTSEFRGQLILFSFFLTDSTYITVWPILQYEVNRLQLLVDAGPQYAAGVIDIRELHKRFIDNWFYDQINMGSANFVTVSFQQFLNRNPLSQELSAGISMVDGNFSVLFLQSGSSKDDYLAIFYSSSGYEEGNVVRAYRKFLQRDPGSQEMSAATSAYHLSNDYEKIQKDILITDEFAGI